MLDTNYILNNLELVERKYQERDFAWDKNQFLALVAKRKDIQPKIENLRNQANTITQQIGRNKTDEKLVQELKTQAEKIKDDIKAIEQDFVEAQEQLNEYLMYLPNLQQDTVPYGENEKANVEVGKWGHPIHEDWHKEHDEIGEKLGMDAALGAKLSGARFTVLSKNMATLHRALVQFMLTEHLNRDYEEVYVPYMVKAKAMKGTGQLPKFGDDMFYVEKDDMYLIPTAEVPVTNLLADEILSVENFPIKYVAHTPCFRREVGAAGRDTKGMIRQHQFDKVELVKFTLPEQSENEFKMLLEDAKNILEKLNLPYREVLLCTGDMGFGSSKTHDLEVWLPGQNAYREISSVTNFQDFQARRMGLRYKDGKKKVIPHTINGSALAIGRTLVAIIENYQQPDGTVLIPQALLPWMNGVTVLK